MQRLNQEGDDHVVKKPWVSVLHRERHRPSPVSPYLNRRYTININVLFCFSFFFFKNPPFWPEESLGRGGDVEKKEIRIYGERSWWWWFRWCGRCGNTGCSSHPSFLKKVVSEEKPRNTHKDSVCCGCSEGRERERGEFGRWRRRSNPDKKSPVIICGWKRKEVCVCVCGLRREVRWDSFFLCYYYVFSDHKLQISWPIMDDNSWTPLFRNKQNNNNTKK